MYYKVDNRIYGDRSVFGYSHDGGANASGSCSSADAVDILDESRSDHDWCYVKWEGDTLTVQFERRETTNQVVEEVTLTPEYYAEFLILKKWEITNGNL